MLEPVCWELASDLALLGLKKHITSIFKMKISLGRSSPSVKITE